MFMVLQVFSSWIYYLLESHFSQGPTGIYVRLQWVHTGKQKFPVDPSVVEAGAAVKFSVLENVLS